ncbi:MULTISPECIES: cystathionine gamma-lyase [unclassified Modestobacter]|uniref:cystathionine gamma-lyase n=1 Tax=unclassified Modestobacter TaxID=2643866 RepID=UPI0022AA6982|nr:MULTISPECIES: cystathionine gamma-lyase [unclassified Modestobacter]MCZ2824056.1 cystathionine gamma-lyase [Modestobacter sp. VKM Ac-2981]MCZ2852301.1 cystathionine gamma-lyase [Modestobacter sp. VKM Ac-2982]
MTAPDLPPELGDGTRLVHAGDDPAVPGTPLRPSPVFAAPYHLGDEAPGWQGADGYARPDNPTLRVFERAVGELDGGDCLSFATGMAAISSAVLALVAPGDRVVLPADGYYATRVLARDELARFGVQVQLVPTLEIEDVAARGDLDGARLVLLETPSNPQLDVCDIAAVARATQASGAVLVVDNTTASPIGQRPLALGADVTVGSDTKALTGHSDVLLGHVSTARTERGRELHTRMAAWRKTTGNTPGVFEAWLAHRSMGTLDLRLARQAANAAALSELLAGHPAVSGVRWPWRPQDPSYALATRQMLRPSGVVSAELADSDAVARLVRGSRLVAAATSFGGIHTTVDRRAQWGGDAVPAGFVRFSCGIEDTADLVADLTSALGTLG